MFEDEEGEAIVVEVDRRRHRRRRPRARLGLEGLEDRVESLDGALEIASPLGRRHALRATIPVAHGLRLQAVVARRTPPAGLVHSGLSALPTGTVTFLFADVEGSTKLVQTVGGVYPA